MIDLNIYPKGDTGVLVVDAYPVDTDGNTDVNAPLHSVVLLPHEVGRLNEDSEIWAGEDTWVGLELAPDWLKDKFWMVI